MRKNFHIDKKRIARENNKNSTQSKKALKHDIRILVNVFLHAPAARQ